MALTLRSNGTGASNLIQAAWFNDFANLLTGAMADQPVVIQNGVTLGATSVSPTAPTLALQAGTGLSIGTYTYAVAFNMGNGRSLVGATATITTTSGNQQVSLSAIPLGPAGTNARIIYRSKVGGTQLYQAIWVGDNTTTTATDNVADTTLTSGAPIHDSFGGYLQIKNGAGNMTMKVFNDGSIWTDSGKISTDGNGNFTIYNGTLTINGTSYLGNTNLYGTLTMQPGQALNSTGNVNLQATSGIPGALTAALAAVTSLSVGAYNYGVTFLSADGGETNLGTQTNITTTTNNQNVNLSAIPLGPAGCTRRNIYRTKVGGTTHYLLATLNDNTTTTYADTIADTALPTTQPPAHPTFGGALTIKDQTGTVQAQITSDGRVDANSVNFTSGSISRIGVFGYYSGGTSTVTHNWGVVPDLAIVVYTGQFGGFPANVPYTYGATTTTVTAVGTAGVGYFVFLLKF